MAQPRSLQCFTGVAYAPRDLPNTDQRAMAAHSAAPALPSAAGSATDGPCADAAGTHTPADRRRRRRHPVPVHHGGRRPPPGVTRSKAGEAICLPSVDGETKWSFWRSPLHRFDEVGNQLSAAFCWSSFKGRKTHQLACQVKRKTEH